MLPYETPVEEKPGGVLLKKHPGEDLEAEAGREVIPCNSKLKEKSPACNKELKFTAYKSSGGNTFLAQGGLSEMGGAFKQEAGLLLPLPGGLTNLA